MGTSCSRKGASALRTAVFDLRVFVRANCLTFDAHEALLRQIARDEGEEKAEGVPRNYWREMRRRVEGFVESTRLRLGLTEQQAASLLDCGQVEMACESGLKFIQSSCSYVERTGRFGKVFSERGFPAFKEEYNALLAHKKRRERGVCVYTTSTTIDPEASTIKTLEVTSNRRWITGRYCILFDIGKITYELA
uniref:Uncharacterized protein n=1 Tax=Marseillevirus LCMAC103 TaxID=2506604 RepID=A0A481YVT3_9VIRU|nr:MAG: hypothetical protein LCMAC103_03550 [Marseillevirus LCMAC103]